MTYLLLIRHAESSKNRLDKTASPNDVDHLTELGELAARKFSREVGDFAARIASGGLISITSSDSWRATETAAYLGDVLNVQARTDTRLRSIVVSDTAGLTYQELKSRFPNSAAELDLYRAGVFNSYTMEFVGNVLMDFEQVVARAIKDVIGQQDAVAIVVAHRSVITAVLLSASRECLGYPKDFYGYIELRLGSLSALEAKNGRFSRIIFVNRQGDFRL